MSLIPLMKLRLATPTVLVDVGRVTDLSYVRDGGDHVAIGALTRHRDLETERRCSPRSAVCCGPSRPRSATTRCGTAARSAARPRTAIRRPISRRCCSRSMLRSWCEDRAANARSPRPSSSSASSRPRSHPTSCSCEIRVPKTGANGFDYQKFNRRAQDWAIVGAVAARVNGGTNVALVNMGQHARCARPGSSRRWRRARSAADAAAHAAEGTEPTQDLNASPEYREHLARVLVRARSKRLTNAPFDRSRRPRRRARRTVRRRRTQAARRARRAAVGRARARRRARERCRAR